MGLDWEPFGKPKPGFEAEFWALMGQLTKEEHWLQPLSVRHSPIPEGVDKKTLRQRLSAIQISPYETLGAPRVGRDPEAEAWIRSKYDNAPNKPASIDEWVEKFQGYYVIALVPDNDGLPVYSNHALGSSWERWSFRAQFFGSCRDVLDEVLFNKAWVRHTAPQLADYGERLMTCARAFAAANGVADLLPLRSLDSMSRAAVADVVYPAENAARRAR